MEFPADRASVQIAVESRTRFPPDEARRRLSLGTVLSVDRRLVARPHVCHRAWAATRYAGPPQAAARWYQALDQEQPQDAVGNPPHPPAGASQGPGRTARDPPAPAPRVGRAQGRRPLRDRPLDIAGFSYTSRERSGAWGQARSSIATPRGAKVGLEHRTGYLPS